MDLRADLLPAYLPIMGAAVTATNTMAQIGANGTTSNGLTPNPLPSQYMANVELWLFDDDNLVTQIQRESMPSIFSHVKFSPLCPNCYGNAAMASFSRRNLTLLPNSYGNAAMS